MGACERLVENVSLDNYETTPAAKLMGDDHDC
jgi:hypothetical protein